VVEAGRRAGSLRLPDSPGTFLHIHEQGQTELQAAQEIEDVLRVCSPESIEDLDH
jgi:hypothetical protein